jgi:hypothetical protein
MKNLAAWHCAKCAHVRTGRWIEAGAAGITVMIIGLVLLAGNLIEGGTLTLFGGVVTCWSYAHVRRQSARARDSLPVALHPKVSNVQIVERLRAKITLDEIGDYRVERAPVNGRLAATLTFDRRDGQRVEHRRKMFGRDSGEAIRYMAGALVPQGRVGINGLSADLVIRTDDEAARMPVLSVDDPPATSRRVVSRDYDLSIPPDVDAGPVWITPSLAPESGQQVLELDIQWPEFGPKDGDPLVLDVIESLKIRVPVSWGKVQGVTRDTVVVSLPSADEDVQALQTIKWTHLVPSRSETEARRLTLKVLFEDRVLREDSVSGNLEASMKGALSGVSGMLMYGALGGRRTVSGKPSVKTSVEAEFSLSLASIRYQSVRVFPDRVGADENHRDDMIESEAIPDDETIIALTNALGEEGFYVKRVAENPPRSGGKAHVMHRYWDIAGRSYEGVYPVDFHMVVTGEEVHRGDVRPESGHTKIQISVQGAYVNDEMYERVESVWARLHVVTEVALGGKQK